MTLTLALMGLLVTGCTASATDPVTEEPEKETPSQQEENTGKETSDSLPIDDETTFIHDGIPSSRSVMLRMREGESCRCPYRRNTG